MLESWKSPGNLFLIKGMNLVLMVKNAVPVRVLSRENMTADNMLF